MKKLSKNKNDKPKKRKVKRMGKVGKVRGNAYEVVPRGVIKDHDFTYHRSYEICETIKEVQEHKFIRLFGRTYELDCVENNDRYKEDGYMPDDMIITKSTSGVILSISDYVIRICPDNLNMNDI
jgi:hypothetical protein